MGTDFLLLLSFYVPPHVHRMELCHVLSLSLLLETQSSAIPACVPVCSFLHSTVETDKYGGPVSSVHCRLRKHWTALRAAVDKTLLIPHVTAAQRQAERGENRELFERNK